MTASGLYPGVVTHTRLKPRRHALAYNIFMLLSIKLNGIELLIEQFRNLGIIECILIHNLAPPAPIRVNINKNRTFLSLRFFKRLFECQPFYRPLLRFLCWYGDKGHRRQRQDH